jgi:phosphate-selective porin OprO/OprP
VLHLGGSVVYTDYSRAFAPTFSTRPETGIGDNIATTGAIANADSAFRYGAEMAFVYDKFSLQGEFMGCSVDRTVGADPSFTGYYVMGSWMITGPCRNYKKDGAHFDRVKPCNNFGCNGWGGWELAARYSYVDLTDSGIAGGEVWDITVGLNWYLNPNTRLMLNYVHSDLTNRVGVVNGSLDAVGIRVQVDF